MFLKSLIEVKVFQDILKGLTTKQIAEDIGYSLSSTKNILKNIYQGHGVKNKLELIGL